MSISLTRKSVNTANSRSLSLVEALAFCAFVACYIWQFRASFWSSWLVFPIWLVGSILLHRDTPSSLGWRADNLWSATMRSTAVFTPCVVVLGIVGLCLGVLHGEHNQLLASKHF